MLIGLIVAAVVIIIVMIIMFLKPKPPKPDTLPAEPKTPFDGVKKSDSISKPYPIEEIRTFMETDYEETGYNDAQTNDDDKYKQQRIKEIQEKGKNICSKIILEYMEKIKILERWMTKYKREGCVDSEEELKTKKDIYDEHIKEIGMIKTNLNNSDLGIYASYDRGFAKWQKAINEGLINEYK